MFGQGSKRVDRPLLLVRFHAYDSTIVQLSFGVCSLRISVTALGLQQPAKNGPEPGRSGL
jgi:hypothetical protein